MKVKETKIDDEHLRLSVTATVTDVDRAFAVAERSFARSLGLTPVEDTPTRELIQQKLRIRDVDDAIASQVLDALVPFALDKTNITPLVMPTGETKEKIVRGKPLSFTVTVMPKPSFTLSSYEPVEVSVPKFRFDDSTLEAGIKNYIAQFPEYRRAEEQHEVREGDSVRISLALTEDGEAVTNLSTDSRTLSLGNDYMPPNFESEIVGMEPGGEKSFDFDVDGYDAEGHPKTHHYHADVTVFEIQERCEPELTDEWVKTYLPMYGTVEDAHRMFRQSLEQQQRKAYNDQVTAAVEAKWAERFDGSIPDEAYQATARSIDEMLKYQLKAKGIDYDEFVAQQGGRESFQMGLLLQARDTLRRDYALDAVFDHEHLAVTEDDANAAAKEFNPSDPEQARRELAEEGKNFAVREIAVRVAASRWCVQNAKIEVTDEEWNAYAPAGSQTGGTQTGGTQTGGSEAGGTQADGADAGEDVS